MKQPDKPDPLEETILRVIQNISEDVQSTKAIVSELENQKTGRVKNLNWILWLSISVGVVCIGGIVWALLY